MESKQPINPFNQPLADTTSANAANNTAQSLRNSTNPVNTPQQQNPSSDASANNNSTDNQDNLSNSAIEEANYSNPSRRSWLMFGITCFLLMLIYIYNSGHANKGLRTKEKLSKELKELNSESISLESQITNASTQSALTKRLEGTGLKEITTPPTKLVKKKKDE